MDSDGVVYFGSTDGGLYAVSSTARPRRIESPPPPRATHSSPFCFVCARVAAATEPWPPPPRALLTQCGHTREQGALKWKFATGGAIEWSAPALGNDGTVYIGSDDHFVYAINGDGTLKWKFETKDKVNSSPVVDDQGSGSAGAYGGTVFCCSNDGNLYALGAALGELRWQYTTQASIYVGGPFVTSDAVYTGSQDSYVYALNKQDGSLKWKNAPGGAIQSRVVVTGGVVYVGSSDTFLYALTA